MRTYMTLAALFILTFAINAAALVVVSLVTKRELPARDVVLASAVAAGSAAVTLMLVVASHG